MEHEGDGDTNSNSCAWNKPQSIGKRTGSLENKRTIRDHPDYSIIKIDKNTEKSLGLLKRFPLYRTPVKNYRFTLVWGTVTKGLLKGLED